MALLMISGVEMPTPSEYQVGIMDLSQAERNVNGEMIIERIATKRKLELAWALLTGSQYKLILEAVSAVVFPVTYFDPMTNGLVTKTFYAGDRVAPMMIFNNGAPTWKDVKFSLVEK